MARLRGVGTRGKSIELLCNHLRVAENNADEYRPFLFPCLLGMVDLLIKKELEEEYMIKFERLVTWTSLILSETKELNSLLCSIAGSRLLPAILAPVPALIIKVSGILALLSLLHRILQKPFTKAEGRVLSSPMDQPAG
uniref:Uncharacterized protein n=1 Tax=Salix viminalis TaxID=40686 RepID=A0A6N2KU82_SALVM